MTRGLTGETSTPDRLSVHVKVTETSALFQPLALGPGVLDPMIRGEVLSILILPDARETEFPALSAQLPVTVWPAPSPVRVVGPE